MLRPEENTDDWFNLFILHQVQNRNFLYKLLLYIAYPQLVDSDRLTTKHPAKTAVSNQYSIFDEQW